VYFAVLCCAVLSVQLEVAVEIIGERSLRIEELEEDIADMKAIFHAQLDEAAKRLAAAKQRPTQPAAQQAAATGEEG
jgi:hypothetical protein